MPGFAGYTNKLGTQPDWLDSMSESMRHRSDFKVDKHIKQHFAMATVDLPSYARISVAGNDKYLLFIHGSVYEEGGVRVSAQELLKRWEASGKDALTDLNGEYVIGIWDENDRELLLTNDRLGMKRLHYWQGKELFAFASELKALAALPDFKRTVNQHALSELLTFGHLQDDRTLLEDARLLPPASWMSWKNGALKVSSYWQFDFKSNPKWNTIESTAKAYGEHLIHAVSRRLPKSRPLGILLSGGLDSRAIAGAIRHELPDAKMRSWTTGHGHDHDTRFARDLARVLKSDHTSVVIPEPFLSQFAEDYSWILDGMVSTHGCHRMSVFPAMRGQVDHAFIGYLGDRLSGGTPLYKVADASNVQDLISKGYPLYANCVDDEWQRTILKKEVYQSTKGLAFDAFSHAVREAHAETLPDRLMWADMRQRQRLWNPPALMDLMEASGFVAITPFADKDFINFTMSLPLSLRLHKEAYVEMIKQSLKPMAKVGRSGDVLPLIHSRIHASLYWRWLLFRRNQLHKWTGGRYGTHAYAAFVHCGPWYRRSNRKFIETSLLENPVMEEHFNMDGLKKMVVSFMNAKEDRYLEDAISATLSYALFRRRLEKVEVPQVEGRIL